MKGQVAFESLFLMLVVLSASIAITSIYLQTHQDTIALSITKEETVKQLAAMDSYVILKKLDLKKTSSTDINIDVYLEPSVQIDTSSIKTKILSKTSYTNLNINLK